MEKLMSITKKDLLYPSLSYNIIGAAFKVFNDLGFGHKESYYQRALAHEFDTSHIAYQREVVFPCVYENKTVGKYISDFIIEDKIIIELKVKSKLGYVHVHQVLSYLRVSQLKLAIIIYFTSDGVKYRRVVNNS